MSRTIFFSDVLSRLVERCPPVDLLPVCTANPPLPPSATPARPRLTRPTDHCGNISSQGLAGAAASSGRASGDAAKGGDVRTVSTITVMR